METFPNMCKSSRPPMGELLDNPSVSFSKVSWPTHCIWSPVCDVSCFVHASNSVRLSKAEITRGRSMKKVILFATLAVFLTGVSFAQRGAARPGPNAGTFAPNARAMPPDSRTIAPNAVVHLGPNATRTAPKAEAVDRNTTTAPTARTVDPNATTVNPNVTIAPNGRTIAPNPRTVAPDAVANSPNAQNWRL
jgi:hypothetical protein